MNDKMYYVVYRDLDVAWYDHLEEAIREALEREEMGHGDLEVMDSDGVVYWCSADLLY